MLCRERLERLERERHRIEKEKDREYWAKMKKSEQEQGPRSDIERRSRPEWARKDTDDRDRQISGRNQMPVLRQIKKINLCSAARILKSCVNILRTGIHLGILAQSEHLC